MDLLEEAIEESNKAYDAAYEVVSQAATCEVHAFCEYWQERHHNHLIAFDDGMGSKSFDVYRKHDRKLVMIVGDGWHTEKIHGYVKTMHDTPPIQEIKDFMKELQKTLMEQQFGYICVGAYKLPDRFDENA